MSEKQRKLEKLKQLHTDLNIDQAIAFTRQILNHKDKDCDFLDVEFYRQKYELQDTFLAEAELLDEIAKLTDDLSYNILFADKETLKQILDTRIEKWVNLNEYQQKLILDVSAKITAMMAKHCPISDPKAVKQACDSVGEQFAREINEQFDITDPAILKQAKIDYSKLCQGLSPTTNLPIAWNERLENLRQQKLKKQKGVEE